MSQVQMSMVQEWIDSARAKCNVYLVIVRENDIDELYPWSTNSLKSLNSRLNLIDRDVSSDALKVIDLRLDIEPQLVEERFIQYSEPQGATG